MIALKMLFQAVLLFAGMVLTAYGVLWLPALAGNPVVGLVMLVAIGALLWSMRRSGFDR